jgi:hypothetical protein
LAFELALFGHVVWDGDLLVEFVRLYLEDVRDPHHGFERDHALTPFNAADVLPAEITKILQPLLGEFAAFPQHLQLSAEPNQRAGHVIGSFGNLPKETANLVYDQAGVIMGSQFYGWEYIRNLLGSALDGRRRGVRLRVRSRDDMRGRQLPLISCKDQKGRAGSLSGRAQAG